MEKSKAAVFVGMEKPLEVREFEVAPVTADTALVRMQMAAVCGSDVHYWHLPTTPAPAIMGHENVGVLAALGKNVTKDVLGQPLKEGDRVLFKRSNCGRCPGCVLGENCKVNPPYGLRPKFEPPYLKGGFSQYVYLDPNPWLLKVPEDLSTERALISNIGNHTLLRGIEKIGGVALADTVVVQGSGPIGMGAIIQASIAGAGRIILVGAPANRLELGVEMGAGLTIDLADYPTPEARVARVQELTGGQGADMVIECSGGRTAVQEGLDMVRSGGKYLVIGQIGLGGPQPLDPSIIVMKALRVEGVAGGGASSSIIRSLKAMHQVVKAPVEKLITHAYSLEQVNEGFEAHEQMAAMIPVVKPNG